MVIEIMIGTKFKLNSRGESAYHSYINGDMTPGKEYTVSECQYDSVEWLDDKRARHSIGFETFGAYFDIVKPPRIDITLPLQTRGGTPFTLLSSAGRGDFPLVGQLEGSSHYTSYTSEGFFGSGSEFDDLMNVPEKLTVVKWAATGRTDGHLRLIGLFDSEGSARKFSDNVQRVEIDIVA